jgi:S-adenosylmethionine:tRNA ribosyltransferase-isomerase
MCIASVKMCRTCEFNVDNMSEETNKSISIDAYDYLLPEDQIAEKPLQERDSSKLLIYSNGKTTHSHYQLLAQELPAGTHLFFNNTKVIPARMHFKKSSGGHIEIFLLEPEQGNYADLHAQTAVLWKCMVGGVKKWKNQETLEMPLSINKAPVKLQATLLQKTAGHCVIRFQWDAKITFSNILAVAGAIPLPPYIKRKPEEDDKNRYQTVYAQHNGSVAAPTAGLHFNEKLLQKLQDAGVQHSFLTLHVGAGTFKPVSASTIADHDMHEEHFEMDISTIQILADENKCIIPVGTTSLRTLESLYWLALKMEKNPENTNPQQLWLVQWEDQALAGANMPSRATVFKKLAERLKEMKLDKISGKTGICIVPGYQFRVAEGLITNFHQPRSTLLLLVAAIVGDEWKNIYHTALNNKYRFLSYGDGCLLLFRNRSF